jgi:filamentous hemagglutinin family protein
MMRQGVYQGSRSIFWATVLLLFHSPGQAEITLDGTLGPSGALAGPDFLIPAEIGEQVGGNLFHSFGVFNIDTGQTATFTGPSSIQNVLGRVTGGSPSNIDGMLASTMPNADVYLINPAGVVFGPDAQLDVQGSFHTSTADYVRLGDNGRFAASRPETSILTVAPPSAFGFLDASPAPLLAAGSTLEVLEGETLSVVAGDVRIDGGTLAAEGGRINLASAAARGEIGVSENVDSLARFGDIQLSRALVTASGETGGDVMIRSGRFVVDRASVEAAAFGDGNGGAVDIRVSGDLIVTNGVIGTGAFGNGAAGTLAIEAGRIAIEDGGLIDSSSFGNGAGGRIVLDASDEIHITGSNGQGDRSRVQAAAFSADSNATAGTVALSAPVVLIDRAGLITVGNNGEGRGGRVEIDADGIRVSDGGQVNASTFGSGDAGVIVLSASELFIDRGGRVIAATEGAGSGGAIQIEAGRISLASAGQIDASTFGSGDAGRVRIKAGSILLDASQVTAEGRFSGIFTNARSGDAGTIDIQARTFRIMGTRDFLAVVIDTRTFGAGRGGDLRIVADDLAIQGARVAAGTGGSGRGGNVVIETTNAALRGGAQIDSSSFASGAGGNVTLRARGNVLISGRFGDTDFQSGLFSLSDGTGEGGNLTLIVGGALVMNQGRILTRTLGDADAGTLRVRARDLRLTSGAQIFSGIGNAGLPDPGSEDGFGRGGDLVVTVTDTLSISGSRRGFQSGLFTNAQVGRGDAGNLSVSAAAVDISDRGTISTASTGASRGDAGDIMIGADTVRLRNGSIESEAIRTGGGNIALTDGALVDLADSRITTSVGTGKGRGGDITIDQRFVVLDSGQIRANADAGRGGNIDIRITDNGALFTSADSVIDASAGPAGIDGIVVIDSPANDIAGSITRLPVSFLNAAALLSERCAARTSDNASSFVVVGRRGVPSGPDAWSLGSYATEGDRGQAEVSQTDDAARAGAKAAHVTKDEPSTVLVLGCARKRL